MDDAFHIGAHRVNGSMRSESKMVRAQVSGTLVHNVTHYVHFYLHVMQKKNKTQLKDQY